MTRYTIIYIYIYIQYYYFIFFQDTYSHVHLSTAGFLATGAAAELHGSIFAVGRDATRLGG